MIRFGLDQAAWRPQGIHAKGDTLCDFGHRHRFSKHSTDLGQVTVDPFRIVGKLLLAGILHRSYPNWARPLGVVAKSDGRIQLT